VPYMCPLSNDGNSQCARYTRTLGRQIEQSTTLFYLRGTHNVEAGRLV